VQVGSSRSAALGHGDPLAIVAPMGMQMWMVVSRGVRFGGGIFQGSVNLEGTGVDEALFFGCSCHIIKFVMPGTGESAAFISAEHDR
jgi:hypothetical protein